MRSVRKLMRPSNVFQMKIARNIPLIGEEI